MIPLILDPASAAFAVIGRGDAAARRVAALRAGGAVRLRIFGDASDTVLAEAAGTELRPRLPGTGDLAGIRAAWIAGLPAGQARDIAALARAEGALINVEDDPAACDFHNPAEVRRGDLLLSISTAGKSPRLAARLRAALEARFGPEWAERLAELGARRAAWRAEGRSGPEMAALTDAAIDAGGWL